MSFYLTNTHDILQGFMKGSQMHGNVRDMAPDELETVILLREIVKAMNICMTEMLFTIEVIKRLKVSDLFWVTNNFNRVVHSLYRQRQFVVSVRKTFSYKKPKPEEQQAILKLVEQIRTRIDYLNSVPIPENIKLTPIQDYLDLIGAQSFISEVKTHFQTGKDLYESKYNGQMNEYITNMMYALSEAGKEKAYKERLEAYVTIANGRINRSREDNKARETAYALNESINGMAFFREQFFKGIRTLNGSEKINLNHSAIHHQMLKGNRGKFCILCCRMSKNNLLFRYMLHNGNESASFMNVGVYQSYEEAENAMTGFKERYPADRAFDVVCI